MNDKNFTHLLNYDKETGLFTWKQNHGSVKKGDIAASRTRQGYMCLRVNNKFYLCHRLAWFFVHDVWPSGDIDHINEIKSDNRIVNLRDVDRCSNLRNQSNPQKNNKSGLRGVHWDRKKEKWVAQMSVSKKKIHLGYFDDCNEAYKTYLERKMEMPNAIIKNI